MRTREIEMTKTAMPTTASSGISTGYMSRFRTAWLTSGSPVARSDHARIAHSKRGDREDAGAERRPSASR